jgi:hypothetical protein
MEQGFVQLFDANSGLIVVIEFEESRRHPDTAGIAFTPIAIHENLHGHVLHEQEALQARMGLHVAWGTRARRGTARL